MSREVRQSLEDLFQAIRDPEQCTANLMDIDEFCSGAIRCHAIR